MSKYFKADNVIRKRAEDLAGTSYWEYGNPKNIDEWSEVAEMEFKDLPTIEIVRCRECKYYEDPKHKIFENCVKWKDSHGILLSMKPNDSCSYGERIEIE